MIRAGLRRPKGASPEEAWCPQRLCGIVPITRQQRWSGRAFGLTIDSEFALPGLRFGAPAEAGERPLAIELLPPVALDERRLGDGVLALRDAVGRVTVSIDRTRAGYRFVVAGAGLYELSSDGRRLRCRPVPAAGWEWRRSLIGQVLPFAAVLQGLQVFHASAVEIGGLAVAMAGPSGLGKSALALELHVAGAGFVTDDVLAVEERDGTVVAHPGVSMTKVRRRIAAGMLEIRRPLTPVEDPLPLGAFCLLRASEDGRLHLGESAAGAHEILGSTFNLVGADPRRMNAHIDVCASIATQTRVLDVALPPELDPAVAADLRAMLSAAPVAA